MNRYTVFSVLIIVVILCALRWDRGYPRSVTGEVFFETQQGPPIDGLLIWVDTRDVAWRNEKIKYQTNTATSVKYDEIRLPNSSWSHFEVMQCVPLLLKNLPFLRNLVVVMMRPQTLPLELIDALPPPVSC